MATAEAQIRLISDKMSTSSHVEIVTDKKAFTTRVIVDGIDISYWLTRDPIITKTNSDGYSTITVTLAAPTFTATTIE